MLNKIKKLKSVINLDNALKSLIGVISIGSFVGIGSGISFDSSNNVEAFLILSVFTTSIYSILDWKINKDKNIKSSNERLNTLESF